MGNGSLDGTRIDDIGEYGMVGDGFEVMRAGILALPSGAKEGVGVPIEDGDTTSLTNGFFPGRGEDAASDFTAAGASIPVIRVAANLLVSAEFYNVGLVAQIVMETQFNTEDDLVVTCLGIAGVRLDNQDEFDVIPGSAKEKRKFLCILFTTGERLRLGPATKFDARPTVLIRGNVGQVVGAVDRRHGTAPD